MHTGGPLTLAQRCRGTRPALTAIGLWAWTRETPLQAHAAALAASGSGFWSPSTSRGVSVRVFPLLHRHVCFWLGGCVHTEKASQSEASVYTTTRAAVVPLVAPQPPSPEGSLRTDLQRSPPCSLCPRVCASHMDACQGFGEGWGLVPVELGCPL